MARRLTCSTPTATSADRSSRGRAGDGTRAAGHHAGVAPGGRCAGSDHDPHVLADVAGPAHADGDAGACGEVALERPDPARCARAPSDRAAAALAADLHAHGPRCGHLEQADEGTPSGNGTAYANDRKRLQEPQWRP